MRSQHLKHLLPRRISLLTGSYLKKGRQYYAYIQAHDRLDRAFLNEQRLTEEEYFVERQKLKTIRSDAMMEMWTDFFNTSFREEQVVQTVTKDETPTPESVVI